MTLKCPSIYNLILDVCAGFTIDKLEEGPEAHFNGLVDQGAEPLSAYKDTVSKFAEPYLWIPPLWFAE